MRRSALVWSCITVVIMLLSITAIVQGVELQKANKRIDALEARVILLQQKPFQPPAASRSNDNEIRRLTEYIQRQNQDIQELQDKLEYYMKFYDGLFEKSQQEYLRMHK